MLTFAAFTPIEKNPMSERIGEQFGVLVEAIKSLIAPIALGLFTFAGVVYAVSQALDNDTKKKGERWSMSIATGALIGLLIIFVAPVLVEILWGMGG